MYVKIHTRVNFAHVNCTLVHKAEKVRKKNNQKIISKAHAHLHSMQKTSEKLENCKRSCTHKVPSIFSSERSAELGDSIISLLKIEIALKGT